MQYVFGAYTLDVDRHVLCDVRGLIQLDRQVFAVLTYLVQHHDRVVRRQELFEQLWPNRIVSEAALERCIAVARQTLGDSGRSQHIIQTVYGYGYRFVAPVEERHGEACERAGPAPQTLDTAEAPPRGCPETPWSPVPIEPEPPSLPAPAPATPGGAWLVEPGAPEAERRQLTVLVCRVVGLPESAAPLDPEALLEVLPAFHTQCAEVVRRFAGHLAQEPDESLVVYFGYPQAHEDDARRAVYTGLGMVEAARRLHANGRRLAVRIGIHTGLVVLRALEYREARAPLVLGHTPAIAAQVQRLAPLDTMAVSAATLRLVEGYVVVQPLGAYPLHEAPEPLDVFQVLQARAVPGRFAATVAHGLTPLVGRAQELDFLRACWEQARDGRGQVVVLSGEAGIGKSRLVQALTESLAGEAYTRLEYHCSPYAQQSALAPVVEQLQRWLPWHQEMTPQEKLRTLEEALAPSGVVLAEAVPLLAALLGLPLPAPSPPLPLAPRRQRQQTLEAVVAWWLKEAGRQPVCLVVEDLQWADPSTLELLSLLIDQVPTASMLVLLLGRPEFHPHGHRVRTCSTWPCSAYLAHRWRRWWRASRGGRCCPPRCTGSS